MKGLAHPSARFSSHQAIKIYKYYIYFIASLRVFEGSCFLPRVCFQKEQINKPNLFFFSFTLKSLSSLSDKGLQICPKSFISLLKEKCYSVHMLHMREKNVHKTVFSFIEDIYECSSSHTCTYTQLPPKDSIINLKSNKHILWEMKSVWVLFIAAPFIKIL